MSKFKPRSGKGCFVLEVNDSLMYYSNALCYREVDVIPLYTGIIRAVHTGLYI